MNVVTIHQPSYFPWLGLLHKIACSEIYVAMNEVQLSDSAFQHRNLFLSTSGLKKYINIPYNKKNYMSRRFCDLEISENNWQARHMELFHAYYGKHPFFEEISSEIKSVMNAEYTLLQEPVIDSMRLCARLLNIHTKIICQSEMQYDRTAKKSDLVLALLQSLNANTYLSGSGAIAYLNFDDFNKNKIQIKFDKFEHPQYKQKHTSDFVPGLSVLDLFFNHGVIEARNIFWKALNK